MKCNGTLFISLILLPLGVIYFSMLNRYVQIGNSTNGKGIVAENAGPLRDQQIKSALMTTKTDRQLQQVSCLEYLNDKTIYDPNAHLARDKTKRLTVTEPKFWISLHSESFDKMRYVHIMKRGDYYESGLTALFHQILKMYDTTATTKPPPLMLDIGANIGWFALYSRAHGHEVATFEPNPTMFLRICESLEYNKWDQLSTDTLFGLWNYGLGAVPGRFNLTTGNNPGASSFHEDRLARKFRKKLEVSVVTLDSIAVQEGWIDRQISLMKVDVEGFENNVFEGGKKLIYNGNVENIIMESSINNITIVGGMVDLLYDAGYRVKEILTVNGEPYHEDWWHTFNPALEQRFKNNMNEINVAEDDQSDQIKFLAKVTCNIWWQHKKIKSVS